MIHSMTRSKKHNLPIIIGGIGSAVVISGVGLIARRRFRPKTLDLTEVDLSADEWRGVVEFEQADERHDRP